jgi:hypothetical protein
MCPSHHQPLQGRARQGRCLRLEQHVCLLIIDLVRRVLCPSSFSLLTLSRTFSLPPLSVALTSPCPESTSITSSRSRSSAPSRTSWRRPESGRRLSAASSASHASARSSRVWSGSTSTVCPRLSSRLPVPFSPSFWSCSQLTVLTFSLAVMDAAHLPNQDTNDKFLANIQRDGTYSVVPRMPAGEVTPDGMSIEPVPFLLFCTFAHLLSSNRPFRRHGHRAGRQEVQPLPQGHRRSEARSLRSSATGPARHLVGARRRRLRKWTRLRQELEDDQGEPHPILSPLQLLFSVSLPDADSVCSSFHPSSPASEPAGADTVSETRSVSPSSSRTVTKVFDRYIAFLCSFVRLGSPADILTLFFTNSLTSSREASQDVLESVPRLSQRTLA